MKLILTLFLLIPLSCLSQQNKVDSILNKPDYAYQTTPSNNNLAAQYFEEAGDLMRNAYILYIIGAAMTGFSVLSEQNVTTYLGAGFAGLGLSFQISASGKIKKAGRALRSETVLHPRP